MNPLRLLRSLLVFLCLFVVAVGGVRGDDASSPPEPTVDVEALRIREVFSSHLPDTRKKNSLRLSLHPRFGDLDSRDHLRLTTGLRYGITHRWEAGLETDFYCSHGLGDEPFGRRLGISRLQLSTKFNLGTFPAAGWVAAVGFDASTPLGTPPFELTDGLRHFTPFATFSHRLPRHPTIRVFCGTVLDLVSATSSPGKIPSHEFGDDSVKLTAGLVVDRGRLHYTFETTLATTRVIGRDDQDRLTLRPGVIWEIPWGDSSRWGSKWLVGGSVRASFGPHGTTLGAGAKLRIEFDPKRWRQTQAILRPRRAAVAN